MPFGVAPTCASLSLFYVAPSKALFAAANLLYYAAHHDADTAISRARYNSLRNIWLQTPHCSTPSLAVPTCTQLSATTSGVEYCQDPSTQANSYWANSATCSGPPTNSTFTPNTFTSCQQDPTFAGGAFPSYARQTCVLSASPYTPWVPPGQAYVSTTSYTNVTTDLEQCGVTPLPSEIVYIDTACGTNNAQSVK